MNLRRRFSSYLALNLIKLPNLSRLSGGGTIFDKTITRENHEAIPLQREELLMQRIATPSILQLFLFFFLVHTVDSDGGEKFIQQCRDFGPNAWNTCLEAFAEMFRMSVSHPSGALLGPGLTSGCSWLHPWSHQLVTLKHLHCRTQLWLQAGLAKHSHGWHAWGSAYCNVSGTFSIINLLPCIPCFLKLRK